MPNLLRPDLARYTSALAQANGFDLEALETNRTGHLTSKQQAMVRQAQCKDKRAYIIISIVALAVGGYAMTADQQVIGGILALIIGLFFLSLAGGLDVLGIQRDLRGDSVTVLDGIVTRKEITSSTGGGDSATAYYYVTKRSSFNIRDEHAYRLLDESLSYRLYFLPRSKTLVNIEPLP